MAAYATGEDLVARYDIELVGDLATDREGFERAEVATHPRVLVALGDASGEVEVALVAGARYSVSQLASLPGNSANHLKQIVCGLAMAALHRRRPESADKDFIDSITRDAREAIRALRRGENVFGLDEVIEATVPELSGPSSLDIQHRNDLSFRMHRYFPAAATRLPRGQ